MSVDLSDPEIARIKGELLDPSSSTQWCLVHYNPSSTSPALSLVASGQAPVLSQWKEELAKLQQAGAGVAFGYGDFKGKGCVLHYLNDGIAGVKRARAVVHSRAFAHLFPDYSALITISHPDQLTDALITEKLGLDYIVQRVPTSRPSPEHEPGQQERERIAPTTKKDELPAVPPVMVLGRPLGESEAPNDYASASSRQTRTALTESANRYPTDLSASSTPQSRQVSGQSGPRLPSLPAAQQSRQPSASGGDTTNDSHPDRPRKVSLTTRLGKAFGNPAMQSRISEQTSEPSPNSPTGSGKIMSSFSRAFKRTSGGSPSGSPRAETHDGPPVPPKDDHPIRPVPHASESGDSGRFRTVSGGLGYKPPSPQVATHDTLPSQYHAPSQVQNGQSSQAPAFPEPVSSRLYATTSHDNNLSPSPSAKQIMTEARLKSLTQEEEIQNRFRRDLHLDDRGNGAQEVVVTQEDEDEDDDDDMRLPYDTSDHSISDHLRGESGAQEATSQDVQPIVGADETTAHAQPPTTEPVETQQREPTASHSAAPISSERKEVPGPQSGDERAIEEEQMRIARELEVQRAKEEAQHEEELAARRLQQEAEEFAERQEAQRIQEQEEQIAREAEARRLQEEEARRLQEEEARRRKDEEEEKSRVALEEQRRMDEIRLREEAERARLEQLRRIEEEKLAAERARKEGIKQTLLEGKRSGGVMLRGHVTVQTMKSPIWRRRLFQLLPGEMRLFKNENDDKPIQTIHLGPGASIVHTYEESQVQGSWKVMSGSEEFFVFADSPEEKETILEGLQMAIA